MRNHRFAHIPDSSSSATPGVRRLPDARRSFASRHYGSAVFFLALALAVMSAENWAGSWSTESHLATATSLVDDHTFAIDHSIFVNGSSGSEDKLLVNGHYYSTKTPMLSVAMAGIYLVLQRSIGLHAGTNPDLFCYLMTVATSAPAYAIAVWCIFAIGGRLGLDLTRQITLTASFAFATVALAYAREVNNHIVVLAVACALFLNLIKLADEVHEGRAKAIRMVSIGTLAGLGYTLDQPGGLILFIAAGLVMAYRNCERKDLVLFLVAGIPWIITYHAVNYVLAGTVRPPSSVPAYLEWHGSPFGYYNMTGIWHKRGFVRTTEYAMGLLFGTRGFIGHNLALFLSFPAIYIALRGRSFYRPEIILAGCYAGGTWLAYALLSDNYSGVCLSIRWFVPLLAPGYFVLALFLQRRPDVWLDLLILSGWGAVLGGLMWLQGPWPPTPVPFFWPLQAAAIATWMTYRISDYLLARGAPGAAIDSLSGRE